MSGVGHLPTFMECAVSYITINKPAWRSEKTVREWPRFFELYVYPVIGHVPVNDVDLHMILAILEPIWLKKTETADRLRSRMERVLDWARIRGYRQGDNPARWKGYLDLVLPRPSKIHKVRHHPALPYVEIQNFMALLDKQAGLDARVLEFTILTAVRTSEATKAQWEEIDIEQKIWSLSEERTKTGKVHRVPLSDRAVDVLNRTGIMAGSSNTNERAGWIFPARKREKSISNMAMLMLLRRLERTDITVHGFRSTFRDWAAEKTDFPREIIESALGHSLGNAVELAYFRSDILEKRRLLMDTWGAYCCR